MNYLQYLDPSLVPFAQILLALVLGMILGIERILSGRTAGPRTYGLVSMGACLITVIGVHAVNILGLSGVGDPFPLLASIFNGIGFIGAGIIIFKDEKLNGLTTAAGIWVAAAIGLAVGFQFYLLAVFATFLTIFVFTTMWRAEHLLKRTFSGHFVDMHKEDNA